MLKRMLRIPPRFRRTRFLVFAAIIGILIVRFTHTRHWEQYSHTETFGFSSPQEEGNRGEFTPGKTPLPGASNDKPKENEKATLEKVRPPVSPTPGGALPLTNPKPSENSIPTVPHVVIPNRKILPPTQVSVGEEEKENDIHPIGPPGKQEFPTFAAVPTTIHWEKQVEHFPVPTESIIQLPTGVPPSIPKIQHVFNDETPDAKISREKRQSKVKEEFQKAWAGYKKYAWLHDELSPVSGKFRDPFCGWAATLVDTLDTLWIMDLQEEFEEAARAVDLIDFTTTPRSDIPVFETTIRYLGGLLGAYDVSGGKYRNLLEKAVELGEILMGAFDTPNRMPVLYYRWKPTFASQPHRASQRSNTAELGSLSMEFTRLAQLTGDSRYYDAVARITNALSEWQDRGTKLDGVFPHNIDASGCNKSIPLSTHEPISQGRGPSISPANALREPEGYKPNMPNTVVEPRPKKRPILGAPGPSTLEVQVIPGEPSKAQIVGWGDEPKKKSAKRDLEGMTISNRTESPPPTDPITGLPLDLPGAKGAIGASLGDWDCTPQGLEPAATKGWDKFSMGGGQDSTYEYFPKVRIFCTASIPLLTYQGISAPRRP
jgi:mannosyl-oligosaccharide alpha-1,2-mannosidase